MSYIIGTNTNVKATITIYKRCILNGEKNFALDDAGSGRSIENYLATLESKVINNVNYIKHGLSIEVKLNINQDELEMANDSKDWNYMKIQNGDENPLYYFITNKQWTAKDTIKYSLTMDTLNSFEFNKDYEINKKTLIQRQHKDRLKKVNGFTKGEEIANQYQTMTGGLNVGTYTVTGTFSPVDGAVGYHVIVTFSNSSYPDKVAPPENYETWVDEDTGNWGIIVTTAYNSGYPWSSTTMGMQLYPLFSLYERQIDLLSEGINAPLYKTELGKILDNNEDLTWYLLYRNTQQPDPTEYFNDSPVECFLIPEYPKAIHTEGAKNLTTSELTGTWYLVHSEMNDGASFIINGATFTPSRTEHPRSTWEYRNVTDLYLVLNISGGVIYYHWWQCYTVFNDDSSVRNRVYTEKSSGSTNNVQVNYSKNTVWMYETNSDPHTLVDGVAYVMGNKKFDFTGGSNYQLKSVGEVDRTDSRNIKLIALPYCPAESFLDANGRLNFDANFSYDSGTGWMKANNIAEKFSNDITYELDNPFNNLFFNKFTPDVNAERNDEYESKLLHSDYFRYKFIYDSFSRVYELEKYDFSNYFTGSYKELPQETITFVMTRTINSKFLFQFDTTYMNISVEDYDGICCVSRNNEEPLYNSAYINYIKAGYNYDKKSLQRQTQANQIGLGISIASAVAGILASIATQNPIPAVMSFVGAGLGIATQVTSMAKTTAQGEQAIQQKLDETSRQAVSVAGSDDIDLLTAYSGNRAKMVVYEISERMKKAMGDVFYYCGYKIETQGIPNKSSRYWFNFVQCELVINETANLPDDILEDIRERFKTGVTYFHYHGGYDFKQEKENWEVALIGG